ncbi:MAG: hypothetical protein HRU24_00900 [Gammaproteobacteria bacterium]|nr:hypothetical protein [Gammaproteobacteria bacterium]
MTKNKTTILGFITAPLVSTSIVIIHTAVFGSLDLITFIGLLLIIYWFSLLATFFFGVPAFLIFRRYNMISCWSTLGSGVIIGALITLILVLPNSVRISELITMSAIGGISGFSFWLIWSCGSD